MSSAQLLAPEAILLRIATVRGQRVIVDADLAALYEVETKRFNEAVKRNLAKFPADFMFQLSAEEWAALRSQFATLNAAGRGQHRKYLPYAFTEHGAIMAANLLSSACDRGVGVRGACVRAHARVGPHAYRPGQAPGGTRREDRGTGHEPRQPQPQYASPVQAGLRGKGARLDILLAIVRGDPCERGARAGGPEAEKGPGSIFGRKRGQARYSARDRSRRSVRAWREGRWPGAACARNTSLKKYEPGPF
jgi:ORF6N domain